MSKLRALVIGVNEYSYARPCPAPMPPTEPAELALPSAAIDARNVTALLMGNANRLGFSDVSGKTLVGRRETTQESILENLAKISKNTGSGDQIVLYFSGHSVWARHTGPARGEGGAAAAREQDGRSLKEQAAPRAAREQDGGRGVAPVSWFEMALCPSDTRWDSVLITGTHVGYAIGTMLKKGACLELILETCSAQGLKASLPRLRFGERTLSGTRFARWDASRENESSHSGPHPPCRDVDPQGLFTRFFCDEFIDPGSGEPRQRGDLVQRIRRNLARYQQVFYECCKVHAFGKNGRQRPDVGPPPMLALQTLRTNCSGKATEAWDELDAFAWEPDPKMISPHQ